MHGMPYLSFRTALAVLVLLVSFSAPPYAIADTTIVTSATPSLIEGQLNQAGLKFTKHNAETYFVELGAGEVRFALFNKGTFLAAHFGIKDPATTLEKLNTWNATKYFARAYRDDQGDPALEAELDLEKGVTADAVGQFIQRFRASIVDFVKTL